MKTEQEIIEKIIDLELKLKTFDKLSTEGILSINVLETQINTLKWVIQS